MPKKKKGKPGGDSETGGWSSVKRRGQSMGAKAGGDGGSIAPGDTYSEEEIRTQELRYLQDMFAGKLDPVVVHMIMNDCEFKVEAALETLFELSDQTSTTESQLYRLSGFRDVYIPQMEEEEDDDEDQEEEEEYVSRCPDSANHIVMQPQLESSWHSVNSADSGGPDHQLRSRGVGDTVHLPPGDLELPMDVKGTIQEGGLSDENRSSMGRVDSLDNLSSQRDDTLSYQAFRMNLQSEQDSSSRNSSRKLNSPINDLSRYETSETMQSSRDEGGGSKERGGSKEEGGADIDPSSESEIAKISTHQMNIDADNVPKRFLKAKSQGSGILSTEGSFSGSPDIQTCADISQSSDNQLFDRGASASEVGPGHNPPVSDDLETLLGEAEMHPKRVSMSIEQLYGRGFVAQFEAKLKQDPPSRIAEVTSGSSPIELPSDELETLLGEIQMCPEKASMSEEKVEPSITSHPGLAFETPVDPADTENSGSPTGMKIETDSHQNDQVSSGQSPTYDEPNHQPSQITMEIVPDDQQEYNLSIDAPSFIPRAYAMQSTPPGHHQYQPPQGFQPRIAHRMPGVHHPAGRASSLQRHLNQFDGEVGKPFFTPFHSSQEQSSMISIGVKPQGRHSPQPAQHFPHPAQNFPPREGSFRPRNIKSHSQTPIWQQNQASHQQQQYPRMPSQDYRPFHPRTMSPVLSAPREGTPPPERLRTNSPHEGARQPPDPPKWAVFKHPSYAPRTQCDRTRQPGTEDKAVPLPGGKVLCLMRGCPGSGKSTLARKLVGSGRILSTDDYFFTDDGQYHFDVTKLSEAHDWSHKRAQEAMKSGLTPLIIDNTNIERWTMKPYVAMALQHGYAVEFREPTTPWKFKLGKLCKYNTHGVPRERIKLMIERFERDVTVENILGSSKPTQIKRKMAEAAKRPPSPKSWRRTKKDDKGDLEVDGITADVREKEQTSWRNQRHRDDATTDEKKMVEDDVIAASSTVVEGSPVPVVASVTHALAVDALVTDVLATDAKKEVQSEDEMFMSEDDDFDALMDSLACDSVEEATEVAVEESILRTDKPEVNKAPLGDLKDDEDDEVGKAMITTETVIACETDAKSEPGMGNEVLTQTSVTDVRDDAEKTAEDKLTSGRSSGASREVAEELLGVKEENMHEEQPGEPEVREADEDGFLAMVNAFTEESCNPLPVIASPKDVQTLQSGGKEEEQQIHSIGEDDFAALMKSFSQAPYQSTDELPSKRQEPSPSGIQKDGDNESSNDEDDFAAMMNLVAGASCEPVAACDTRDDDLRGTEISFVTDDSKKPGVTSLSISKDENLNEAQTDDIAGKDDKTEDDAANVSVEETSGGFDQDREQADELQQLENQGGADGNEDENDFSAMMKAVTEATSLFAAETADSEKLVLDESQNTDSKNNENVEDNGKAQEVDSVVDSMAAHTSDSEKIVPDLTQNDANNCHGSGSQGYEPSGTSLDIKVDSALEDTPEADECLECEREYVPVENEIIKEEGSFGTKGEPDGNQQVKTSADGPDSGNSTQEVQVPLMIENEGYSEELTVPERKLETSSCQSVVSTGDINSNDVDSINHRQGTSDSTLPVTKDPSNLTDLSNVSSSRMNVLKVPPSQLSQPVTSTCRSLSPSHVSPSSLSESIVKQDRRKLRRSRSLNKSPRMAAVFPSLSPVSVNWSDLAEQVDQAVEGNINQPQISSANLDSVFYSEAGTMTLASDFSCLQKLESGKLTVEDLQKQGLWVSFGQARRSSASIGSDITTEQETIIFKPGMSTSDDHQSPIPAIVKLHKSTMTDCEKQTEDASDKLQHLIDYFPSVAQNDLDDILTRCMGDVQWATNILLDDFRSIEGKDGTDRDFRPRGTTDGSTNINQEVELSGPAIVEQDVKDSQLHDDKLTKIASMKDLLEAKLSQGKVSQAGNLATNMMSVVDDILKTISSEETKTTTDNSPVGKEQSAEINQVGILDQFPFFRDNKLVRDNSTNLNLGSPYNQQDSTTRVVKTDISSLEQEPVQSHKDALLHDDDTMVNPSLGQAQTSRDVSFSEERSKTNEDLQVTRETDSQIMQEEVRIESDSNDILEGPTQEAAHEMCTSQLTESKQADYADSASAFPGTIPNFHQLNSPVLQQVHDPDSFRLEHKEEQVVRPKTPSRTASRHSSSKIAKRNKPKDVDIHAESPPRRGELEGVRGVQFSWNDPGQEEEFGVPRPEQMMTVGDDAVEVGDGSVMTEEQADAILQEQPVQRKRKEFHSLKEGLILQLPPPFALQLQEMFGSIGFHLLPDGLPAEDLQVHVDYDLAKQLHSLWGQTLQTRFNQEEELDSIIKADEELARKLQQEEDIHHMTQVQSALSTKYQGSKASPNRSMQPINSQVGYGDMSAFSPSRKPAVEGKGLREIMEEELAAQLSKDVEVEEKLSTEGSVSIATKLKRDKLFSEYPTLDRGALEEIFRANSYQLDPTIKQVQSFFISASGPHKDVYIDNALEKIEKELIEMTERESLASSEGTEDSSSQEGFYQSIHNPEYQDYRAEATQHYRQRHEAFQKAAAAYNQGQRQLASFYSQQGHLHTDKLKAANKRASEAIVMSKNSLFSDNTLDLHGLHVDEALLILNQVLSDKAAEISAYYDQQPHPPVGKCPQRHIFIITGKGNRSRGGVARIRPAVTQLLKREGFRFSMPNAGLLKVAM